jgi:hypothetical protein
MFLPAEICRFSDILTYRDRCSTCCRLYYTLCIYYYDFIVFATNTTKTLSLWSTAIWYSYLTMDLRILVAGVVAHIYWHRPIIRLICIWKWDILCRAMPSWRHRLGDVISTTHHHDYRWNPFERWQLCTTHKKVIKLLNNYQFLQSDNGWSR